MSKSRDISSDYKYDREEENIGSESDVKFSECIILIIDVALMITNIMLLLKLQK